MWHLKHYFLFINRCTSCRPHLWDVDDASAAADASAPSRWQNNNAAATRCYLCRPYTQKPRMRWPNYQRTHYDTSSKVTNSLLQTFFLFGHYWQVCSIFELTTSIRRLSPNASFFCFLFFEASNYLVLIHTHLSIYTRNIHIIPV